MIKHFLLTSGMTLAMSAAVLADSTIERIAPENSSVILRAANASKSWDSFQSSGLSKLWESDFMQNMMPVDPAGGFDTWLEDLHEQLGLEEGQIVPPSGEVGVAVFSVAIDDFGSLQTAFLAYADYGDGADKTDEAIRSMLDRASEDHDVEWEQEDVDGHTVFSIDMTTMPVPEEISADGMGDALPPIVPGPDEVMEGVTHIHLTRHDDSFLVCSDMDGLTRALEVVGDDNHEGLAAKEDYRGIVDMLGSGDIDVVVRTQHLTDLMGGPNQMGMMMMMLPMVKSAFGDIAGAGFAIDLDSDNAMLEQRFAVSIPDGKMGIPALLDTGTSRADLPAFVGPDTIGYTSMNFEFDGVVDFLTAMIKSNPFLAMQAQEIMPMIENDVAAVCATLGSEVHMIRTLTRPIEAGSVQQLTAIECEKTQEFEDLIAGLAPQMGMEPRDFLGQRIYSAPGMGDMMGGMGMGGPESMSLGIGGGYVLLGSDGGVEAALRTITASGVASLADDEAYASSVAGLSDGPFVAWGYMNTIDGMEASMAEQRLMMEAMIEEMRADYPEFADEMAAELEADMPANLDFDELREHLGAAIWFVQSTDGGFTGKFMQLEGSGD